MIESAWQTHFRAHLDVAGASSLSLYEHLLQGHIPWSEYLAFIQHSVHLPHLLPEFFRYQDAKAVKEAWTGPTFWPEPVQLVGVWETLPILASVEPLPEGLAPHILVLAHPQDLEIWKTKLAAAPLAVPAPATLTRPNLPPVPTLPSAILISMEDRTMISTPNAGAVAKVPTISPSQPQDFDDQATRIGVSAEAATSDATQIQPFRIPTNTTIQRFDLQPVIIPMHLREPDYKSDLNSLSGLEADPDADDALDFSNADKYNSDSDSQRVDNSSEERDPSDPQELAGLLPEGLLETNFEESSHNRHREEDATVAISIEPPPAKKNSASSSSPLPSLAAKVSGRTVAPPPLPTIKLSEGPEPLAFIKAPISLPPIPNAAIPDAVAAPPLSRPSIERALSTADLRIFPLANVLWKDSDLQKNLENICQEICLLYSSVKILAVNETESASQQTLALYKGQPLQVTNETQARSQPLLSLKEKNPLSLVLRTQKPYHGTLTSEFKPSREAKVLIEDRNEGHLTILPLIFNHRLIGFVAGLSEKQDLDNLHFLQKKTQDMMVFIEPNMKSA